MGGPTQSPNSNQNAKPNQSSVAVTPTQANTPASNQYAQSPKGRLGGLDIPDIAKKTIELAKTLLDQKSTISDINTKIANLEKAAPGTVAAITTSVEALNQSFKLIVQNIPQNNIPQGMQQHVKNIQTTADSFNEFAKSYKTYTDTPDATWYKPWTWGDKTAAAITAKGKWDTFNKNYNDTCDGLRNDRDIGVFFKLGEGILKNAADFIKNL